MISNQHYDIRYDAEKNRVYFKIKGFWRSPDDVPNYLEDWKKIASKVRSGFTVLTDLTETKAQPEEIQKLHEQAQKYMMDKGMHKVAEVTNQAITKLSLGMISKASGMESIKQFFDSFEKAEQWLDS